MLKLYIVKKGDSLWRIAERELGNGTRYKEIKTLNNLTSDTIYEGQTLRIPSESSSETTPESRYEKIGKAFDKALNEIGELKSVQELIEMMGE